MSHSGQEFRRGHLVVCYFHHLFRASGILGQIFNFVSLFLLRGLLNFTYHNTSRNLSQLTGFMLRSIMAKEDLLKKQASSTPGPMPVPNKELQ